MKKIIVLIVLIILSTSLVFASNHSKSVLIIHSYSEDYKWTKDFNEGIINEILESDLLINYRVEYLDTKRNHTKEYYNYIKKILDYKYKNEDIDLIVAVDNNALNVAIELKEDTFKNKPIIAGGINNASSYPLDKNIYIISEDVDYLKTIDYMIKLNEKLKTVYIILDKTTTGKSIKEEMKESLKKSSKFDDLSIRFISEKSIVDIENFTKSLNNQEGILYLLYFVDSEGRKFNYKEGLSIISKESSVPVFTVWDFYLNQGTIGGYLTSPSLHGKTLGETIINYFEGESILHFRNDLSSRDEKILDYKIYNKYPNFFTSKPKKVKWINKPESYFSKNKELILTFMGIIIVLLVIIFLSLERIKNQKIINKKDKKVLNIQSELIYTLGDVIETRSGETGNHVKRVSKIAEFLANKSGYSEISNEIRITSPLHDLGKIGISDKILKKKGKLTEKEYEEIKKHTTIGYDMLKNKNSKILNIASIIAYQHQEQWDGGGYPNNLKKYEISVYARIVAIADVYDALRSSRVYKDAWPLEKVINYFREEKGKKFDPKFVEILLKNIVEIENIREESDKL